MAIDFQRWVNSPYMQRSVYILLFAVATGCASKVTTSSPSGNTNKYSEDLSIWRPKDTMPPDTIKHASAQPTDLKKSTALVEAKYTVNESLDAVLDSISRINKANGVIDGFTIQVYSGVKREEALNAKKEISVALPDLDSDVQYVQPNFRVRVGKYYDRVHAQKDFLAIKRHFPNAIVIPERIPIQ
jgi:hypothetical protein